MTSANAIGRLQPTLLLALRHTHQTQRSPKPSSWTLVYTHRSSNNHRSHVITQSHPGPKARWTPYVHTQETIDHTLLRVALFSTTVVIRPQCARETVVRRTRVVTNRVAYLFYTGLMAQRQAITMIIKRCSKLQHLDAVTPTPLAHRSHLCMRALELGYDNEDTEEHISEAHRDRHTVDCGKTGMYPDYDIL